MYHKANSNDSNSNIANSNDTMIQFDKIKTYKSNSKQVIINKILLKSAFKCEIPCVRMWHETKYSGQIAV